jgi:uncharacterized protein
MRKILLISDNHGHGHEELLQLIQEADEVWHAGDIGPLTSVEDIIKLKPFKAVYGNVDATDVRSIYPENLVFTCENVKVLMTHIAGYPGRYAARVKKIIKEEQPNLVICGHSHICKVMRDHDLNHIHMNPGAYGHHGFHAIRTVLKFVIDGEEIKDLNAVELGKRGAIFN